MIAPQPTVPDVESAESLDLNSTLPTAATPLPLGVKVIASVFYLAAVVFIFLGIMAAFVSSFSLPILGSIGVGLVPGIATFGWGILCFVAGRGLWTGQMWGKVLAITMDAMNIIYCIVTLVMFGSTNYISFVINLLIISYLLFYKGARAAFAPGESSTFATTLAAASMVVYAVMIYPSLTLQQATTQQTTDIAKQLDSEMHSVNGSGSQTSYSPDPTYGPVVQQLTQPGTYSNSTYGFSMNIPFPYFVQELQSKSGDSVLISGTNSSMILISVKPATLALQGMINTDMGDLISNDTLVNTTVAGEPAVHDQPTPSGTQNVNPNLYFLIHQGNYYRIQKTGSLKIGLMITDDQFNAAVSSLHFAH